MPISEIDQYKELCSYARHNDTRLWLIPTTAYSLSLLGFSGASKMTNPWLAGAVAIVVLIVFAAFVCQFARYLAYLVKNDGETKALEEKSPHVSPATHISGMRSLPEANRWFIKLGATKSSGSAMFYAMLATWFLYGFMTIGIVVDRLSLP